VSEHSGPNLSSLTAGQTVAVAVGIDATLRLYINDVDCGIISDDVSLKNCYVVVDLYGRCDKLCVDDNCNISSVSQAVTEYQEKAAKENGNYITSLFTIKTHIICRHFPGMQQQQPSPMYNLLFLDSIDVK